MQQLKYNHNIHNKKNESQNYQAECEEPDIKDYIYSMIYTKVWNRSH